MLLADHTQVEVLVSYLSFLVAISMQNMYEISQFLMEVVMIEDTCNKIGRKHFDLLLKLFCSELRKETFLLSYILISLSFGAPFDLDLPLARFKNTSGKSSKFTRDWECLPMPN